MKRHQTARTVIFIVILPVVLAVAGCGGSNSTPAPTPRPTERPTTAPVVATAPPGALAQMEVAFAGNPSQSTIKKLLDKVLKMYKLERTDDTYSRAGSALVALRQEDAANGCDACTEMAILREMAKGKLPMTFPEAAAWTSAALVSGQ